MPPKPRSYKWDPDSVDPSTPFAFCLRGHPPDEKSEVLGEASKEDGAPRAKPGKKEKADKASEKASSKGALDGPEPDRALPGVGLGTFEMSDAAAEQSVAAALELGYRHIDTAEVYNNETGVGRAVASSGVPRAELFVTTKLWPGNPSWGEAAKTEEQVVEACKASLKRMGLKFVDLYLIHAPFAGSAEARVAQYRGLLECKRLGLTRAVGVSNYGAHHLQEIIDAELPPPQVKAHARPAPRDQHHATAHAGAHERSRPRCMAAWPHATRRPSSFPTPSLSADPSVTCTCIPSMPCPPFLLARVPTSYTGQPTGAAPALPAAAPARVHVGP